YFTSSYAVDVGHRDARGNDAGVADRLTPTAGFGYARRISGTGLTVGAGFFVQGGAGNKFENLSTNAGTRDELSARLGIFKLGPAVSYEASERLRLGAALTGVFGTLTQKLFPGTSVLAPAPFFGIDVDGLEAKGLNARLGLQYLASSQLTLAAVYSPKTKLDFDGGTLRSNQSAAGLGVVTYRDARIDGFALPQEASDARLLASDHQYLSHIGRRALCVPEQGHLQQSGAAAFARSFERGAHRILRRQRDAEPCLVRRPTAGSNPARSSTASRRFSSSGVAGSMGRRCSLRSRIPSRFIMYFIGIGLVS